MKLLSIRKEIHLSILTLLAAGLLCGCAGIPKDQLNAYVGSVGEAKQAGQTLLADWRSARAESDRRVSPPAVAGVSISPIRVERVRAISGGVGSLSAEDTRSLAWDAIGEYTAVLARLNAGESVDDVKKTTGRLFDLGTKIAGSAVPGGDALVTLLKELAGHLEQARLAAEFKKSIRAGAPIIRKIINEVFLEDISDHYRLRATLVLEDLAAVDLETNLDADAKRIKKARISDEWKAFEGSLNAFEALLNKTSASLVALEQTVNQPIDFAIEANRLLDIASKLKQQWTAYENARREARK